MLRSVFLPICISCLVLSLSSCLQDQTLGPAQAEQNQKLEEISLETEESSYEFRDMFLETMALSPSSMTEEEKGEALRILKKNMSEKELDEYRTSIRQSLQQLARQPHRSMSSVLRVGKQTTISASDGSDNDGYGTSVASKGNQVFIGAPAASQVYVNTNNGGTLTETQILTPSNGALGFGKQVAVSGYNLVVSASDGIFGGYLFVFENQGGSWIERQIIHKTGGFDFGRVVKINANYLFTGFRDTTTGVGAKGLIYRRDDDDGIWNLSQELSVAVIAWDADFFDKRLVVASGLSFFAPAFHVFERTGQSWTQTAYVPLPFGAIGPRSVTTHNKRVITNALIPSNKAYSFKINGQSWVLEDELLINEAIIPFAQTRWMNLHRNRLLISVPATGTGDAVYEFKRNGSTWNQIAKHTPAAGTDSNTLFGESLKIDGEDLLIGAPGNAPFVFPPPPVPVIPPAGKVYVY
ncbi:MAG: hypothetical protein AAF587_34845 [Bacteroidota bacterium]